MPIISKSSFGKANEELYQKFSKQLDKPEGEFQKEFKKRIKEMRPLALEIRTMTETGGWKEIIAPFLENAVNPRNSFKILKSDKNDFEKGLAIGKAEAYFGLSMLINNFLNVLNFPAEEKKEEKE